MMTYKLVTIYKSIWYHVPEDLNLYITTEYHFDHHKVTYEMTIRPSAVHIFHCTFTHISAKHIIYTSCLTCSPWWWHSLVKTRGRNIKLICVLCDRLCNVMYDVRHTLTNILWGRQLTIPQNISSCVTCKIMKLEHYQVIQITFSSQMLRAWLTEMLSYIFSWYGTQNGGFREKFLICSHNSLQQEIHDMVQPN